MNATLRRLNRRGSECIIYPDAEHGFHADYRATYNAAAARDGWQRMLDHFARNGLATKGA